MIDLKRSKKEAKVEDAVMPENPDGALYPYGTRFSFDEEVIAKIPILNKVKAGDKFSIRGVCEINEVRSVDRTENKKDRHIEIQIQKIDLKKGSTGALDTSEEIKNELKEKADIDEA